MHERILAARVTLRVLGSGEVAYEIVGRGRKRIVRLDPEDARAIGVQEDAMIEILGAG